MEIGGLRQTSQHFAQQAFGSMHPLGQLAQFLGDLAQLMARRGVAFPLLEPDVDALVHETVILPPVG